MKPKQEPHSLEDCPKWKIPNTNYHLQGRSKAANRTGFMIPELGIFFDIGVNAYTKPTHIFITHTHSDHAFQLPMMFTRPAPDAPFNPKDTQVFVPEEAIEPVINFLEAKRQLSACHMSKPVKRDYSNIRPAIPNTPITLNIKNKEIEVTPVQMNHTVPTIGYILQEIRQKLLPEFQDPNLTKEEQKAKIIEAKKQKQPITGPHTHPIVAYLCDTTIHSITQDLLNPLTTIVIECTFLEPEDLDQAAKTGHIHWKQLKPFILNPNNQNKTFALIHFSKRYKPEEIQTFFQKELPPCPHRDGIPNSSGMQPQPGQPTYRATVAIWLDSGVIEF